MKNTTLKRNVPRNISALVLIVLFQVCRHTSAEQSASAATLDEAFQNDIRDFEQSIGMSFTDEERAASVEFLREKCGVPANQNERYGEFHQGFYAANVPWTKKDLTYRIMQYPSTNSITTNNIEDSFEWAFNTWAFSINLTASAAPANTLEDIKIYFRDIDGPGKVMAYAYYPPSGVIVLDSGEPWYMGVKTGYLNINWVALHEVGHALGLEHSQKSDSIMYPEYSESHPSLSRADWYKLTSLYKAKPQKRIPCNK